MAIKRADGTLLFNPTPQTTLQGGDTLIVVGMRHNLEKLEAMLGPPCRFNPAPLTIYLRICSLFPAFGGNRV